MTWARRSRSGPASDPSRAVAVTSRRATPTSAQRRASSGAVSADARVQPSTATLPSWTSTATTSADRHGRNRRHEELRRQRRGPDHHALRPGGKRRTEGLDACDSRPRPGGAGRRRPRRRSTSSSDGVPENAPSRSTTCSRAAPWDANRRAELDGIASLQRDGIAPPLRKTHGAPLEHVDRRDDLHLLAC